MTTARQLEASYSRGYARRPFGTTTARRLDDVLTWVRATAVRDVEGMSGSRRRARRLSAVLTWVRRDRRRHVHEARDARHHPKKMDPGRLGVRGAGGGEASRALARRARRRAGRVPTAIRLRWRRSAVGERRARPRAGRARRDERDAQGERDETSATRRLLVDAMRRARSSISGARAATSWSAWSRGAPRPASPASPTDSISDRLRDGDAYRRTDPGRARPLL